jgi:hypothetical protein
MHQVLSPSKYERWLGIATDSKAYFYWTFKMSSTNKLSSKILESSYFLPVVRRTTTQNGPY